MSDLTRLNPTPQAIAVYASQPPSPVATQHSLPSRTLPFNLGRTFTGWIAPALPGALIRLLRRLPRASPEECLAQGRWQSSDLMTNWNLVGCTTGISAGLAPLEAWRYASVIAGP